MRWSKGLWVGLSGTSLALAVGCSHGDAQPEATEAAETTAAEARTDAAGADTKYETSKPGWSRSSDDAREADRVQQGAAPTFADTQSNSSPWFLRPPGSPDPNAPRPITTASDVKVETPKPVVGVVKPVQQSRPTPPPGGWRRAACGRG
jgi:hypothetical protein